MHIAVVCMILSLGLFFCIMGAEGTRCNTNCGRIYNPVCGHLKLHTGRKIQCTFGNSCILHARACVTNENWLKQPGKCHLDSLKCRRLLKSI